MVPDSRTWDVAPVGHVERDHICPLHPIDPRLIDSINLILGSLEAQSKS